MNPLLEQRQIERLTSEGLERFGSCDYEAASRVFERVLSLDGDSPIANTVGGICLLNLGRVDEAEVRARNGVRLMPQDSRAHYYLALVLETKESYDEAESETWQAVALEPDDARMRLALGRILFICEREEEAGKQLRHAVSLEPSIAGAHFLLGLILMRDGQLREAREKFEQTLLLEPANEEALKFDALLCMVMADDLLTTPPKLAGYQHAAHLLRRAVELNRSNELVSEWLRLAEETIERISKPTEPPLPPEKWYKTAAKQLLVWVGLAAVSIGMFAAMVWLDESKTADFWVVALFILIFDLLAFGVMSYLRKDFSALPPTIVSFVERVGGRDISPIDTRGKS